AGPGSEERALIAAGGAALAPGRKPHRHMPLALIFGAAGERLRVDAAVGELHVDELAGGNVSRRAQGAAGAVAREGIAALEHAVVAQRSKQLAAAIEVASVLAHAGTHRLAGASGQGLQAFMTARDALEDGLLAEPAAGAFEPGASRAGGSGERS